MKPFRLLSLGLLLCLAAALCATTALEFVTPGLTGVAGLESPLTLIAAYGCLRVACTRRTMVRPAIA